LPIDPNNGDQSDLQLSLSITDVRRKSDLLDYLGEVKAVRFWRPSDIGPIRRLRAPSRLVETMKQGIHPEYVEAHVRCTCGNEFTTRSTKPELHVEICSECHPFYTGRQKLVDTGGRVERFQRRAAKRRK
jgi:large subunit ribosomal protein L31